MHLLPRTLRTSDPRNSGNTGINSNGNISNSNVSGNSNRTDHGIHNRDHVTRSNSDPDNGLAVRRRGHEAAASCSWVGSDLLSVQLGAGERQQGKGAVHLIQ